MHCWWWAQDCPRAWLHIDWSMISSRYRDFSPFWSLIASKMVLYWVELLWRPRLQRSPGKLSRWAMLTDSWFVFEMPAGLWTCTRLKWPFPVTTMARFLHAIRSCKDIALLTEGQHHPSRPDTMWWWLKWVYLICKGHSFEIQSSTFLLLWSSIGCRSSPELWVEDN